MACVIDHIDSFSRKAPGLLAARQGCPAIECLMLLMIVSFCMDGRRGAQVNDTSEPVCPSKMQIMQLVHA